MCFISELMILEGKVSLYKRGYHVLHRRLKKSTLKRKRLKEEVKMLKTVIQYYEDLDIMF